MIQGKIGWKKTTEPEGIFYKIAEAENGIVIFQYLISRDRKKVYRRTYVEAEDNLEKWEVPDLTAIVRL